MDQLITNVSELCTLNRQFHSVKRERELKSLTKYMKQFNGFEEKDFIQFICRQYIEYLRMRKQFCSQAIYNRICAIQSRLNINVLSRRRYLSTLKVLRKLFNPYSVEAKFYTNTGNLVNIPATELQMLRDNAKYLIEKNQTNLPDKWILNTYTDDEIETVYKYFKFNLENFINSQDREKSGMDVTFLELCMIIVFNYHTPRRINEIIKLTLGQVEQLILHNTLNIKSKDGYSIDCIYISVVLADLLNRFVLKLYPEAFEKYDSTFKIFRSSYKMYYTRMRKVLKVLLGEERLKNLRLFHGFRNYFANKHLSAENYKTCQKILGHRSLSVTKRYARGQRKINKTTTTILDYLNNI